MSIKVIYFDVIGTLVDWRGTIIRQGLSLGKGLSIKEWNEFAVKWTKYYTDNDEFKTQAHLKVGGMNLLLEYDLLDKMSNNELNKFLSIWDNLDPWLDTLSGIERLNRHFKTSILSNCDKKMVGLLNEKLKLHYEHSAEEVGVRKPNPEVYRYALKESSVIPEEALMVAAHHFDLEGAKKIGMKTAFIDRGDDSKLTDQNYDYVVRNLYELIDKLGH